MSVPKRRFIVSLVIAVYVLVLLACTLPGQDVGTASKPTVSIIAPASGAQVPAGETVTVQVMAVDARGVTRVDLQVDGLLVATQSLPQPVAAYQGVLTWAAMTLGPHVLLVQATNAAGITSDPAVVSVLVVPAVSETAVVQPPATVAPTPEETAPAPPTVALPTVAAIPTTVPPTLPPTISPTARPTIPPTLPALTGKIAFPVRNPGDPEKYDIWVVNADGSNARLVAQKMRQPCFRSDGTLLAVNGEARYQEHLIVMNADGSNPREVSRHVEDSHPSWSPTGSQLVYDTTAAPGGGWQICIVDNIETRSWRALPDPGGGPFGLRGQYPTWMPDGRIVFKTMDYWASNLQGGLYITTGGMGLPTRVTSSPQDTSPAVNSSGVLAFMSIRQGDDYEIFTAGTGGGLDANLKQLTNNDAQDGLPAWSPDGKRIAFVSDEGGVWGLWVMNADGSGRRKLLNLPGTLGGDWHNERVSWAP